MTQANIQNFGEMLKILPSEMVKGYEARKKEKAEKEKRLREKYGFVLNAYEASRVMQAEEENAICATCSGLPCRKNQNQNRNFQAVIKVEPLQEQIDVNWRRCKYAESAELQRTIERNFLLSKIPKKYIGKSFEDYEVTAENASAVKAAKVFAKELKGGLILHGKPGRGKTFLAAIIAQEVLQQGKSAIFGDVPSMLEDLRSSYSKKNDNQLEEQMKALTQADLVVLDDIGTEKATEWAVNRLYLIVNERYNANKPLIVTSNYTSREIAERLNNPTDAKSAGVTGDRILSRLTEMCEVFTIRGEDRRLKK